MVVGDEIGEPADLKDTSHGMVFLHGLKVPAVNAVPVGEGLDTAKNPVGYKAINGGEEAGNNRNSNFILIEDVHNNRFQGVNNSFPGERRRAGKFHRYISSFVFDNCFSSCLPFAKYFIRRL